MKIPDTAEALVYSKRPLLKDLLAKHGSKTLEELAAYNVDQPSVSVPERKRELLIICNKIVEERLGAEIARGFTDQLGRFFVVSSADHHGMLNSALAMSSNLVISRALKDDGEYIPVFSCAGISLSNEDFPRGLVFHDSTAVNNLIRLSLLPSNSHSSAVYNFRAYTSTEVKKIYTVLSENINTHAVSMEQGTLVKRIIEEILGKAEIIDSKSFCEQITKINFFLWNELPLAKECGSKKLIYLEIEEIVSRLLVSYHLQPGTLIHSLLFSRDTDAQLLQPLTDAMEKFIRQGRIDTCLFWYLSPKNQRKAMLIKGNALTTEDGLISFVLKPETIREAIQQKKLMPSLLLIYTVLHLYYGLSCMGGFNQMHYLAAMAEAYRASKFDARGAVARSQLYNYGFNVLNTPAAPFSSATPFDTLLYDLPAWKQEVMEQIQHNTLAQIFVANLPIIYSILAA